MEAQTVIAVAGMGAAAAGSVLVWLVKIEHRLTRLETMILERLPARAAHVP